MKGRCGMPVERLYPPGMWLPGLRLLLAAVAVLMALSGCGGDEPEPRRGEAATWKVDPVRPPQATDMKVLALVSRVECAGGRTGRVLAPVVAEDEQRVVVTYTVERTPDKGATCPGNQPVGQTFTLEQALGNRPLFDGSCPRPEDGRDCDAQQVWPIVR